MAADSDLAEGHTELVRFVEEVVGIVGDGAEPVEVIKNLNILRTGNG